MFEAFKNFLSSDKISRRAGKTLPSLEELAEVLRTNKDALEAFEQSYQVKALSRIDTGDFFSLNAKDAALLAREDSAQCAEQKEGLIPDLTEMKHRIVQELLARTSSVYVYDGVKQHIEKLTFEDVTPVSLGEINALPEELQPQLTGSYMQTDVGIESWKQLALSYKMYKEESDPKKKQYLYGHFRQGLDILDLDPVLYAMLGMNQNAMGYWLPKIVPAAEKSLFIIPATRIVKVPITLLQLSRKDYDGLTRTTLDIVDAWARKVFELDTAKEYFIKTGTYSSKFDFRNAYIHGPQEIQEIGQYLLFIQCQAQMMAGPLSSPSIYGVSTTNEWVVREFIRDKEDNPKIYKGLPLHTEYRAFVDFDTNELLGIRPYWDPDIMQKRFRHAMDSDSPHNLHDSAIFCAHEPTLMRRYWENEEKVSRALKKMLPAVDLTGQWSVDIMQNGNDFWLIDMAWAQNSALNECIPESKRKWVEEDWIPRIPTIS